nr:restriction endonuclease subunit S [Butyricicoccus sp. GAM44]
MTEWIECTLDKLGEIVGGATPSTKCEDYYGGSIPWITPKDLSSFKGRYITSGERNITEKGLASCSAQMMPKDAVLFTSRAPIGYVAIASQSVCTNQGFKSIVVNEKADPLFVYYLLKYNKDAIEVMGSGTTFKEVSGKTMRAVKVHIPLDVSYQKRIAAVLDSLDTKIENNERINDNLAA